MRRLPPPDTKFNRPVRVDMGPGSSGLIEWAVLTDEGESLRRLAPLQNSATKWRPSRVYYERVDADGIAISTDAGSTINTVAPLAAPVRMPKISKGVVIKDEATGLQRISGQTEALDAQRMGQVLAHAAERKPLSGDETVSPRCGADCLAYLLWLSGYKVPPEEVLGAFNGVDDGVMLLEIRRAASKFGLELTGWRGTDKGIDQLRLPAILSTRNTHFVIVVNSSGTDYVVIDPPYSVRLVPKRNLVLMWSGYALTPGDKI